MASRNRQPDSTLMAVRPLALHALALGAAVAVVAAAACGKGEPSGGGGAAPGPTGTSSGPAGGVAPVAAHSFGKAVSGEANQGAPAHRSEPIAVLDALYEVEPPRSTATDEVAQPFVEVTPTAAAPAPATQGPGGIARPAPGTPQPSPVTPAVVRWTRPTIVLGRRQWFLDGRPMGAVRCSGPAGLCDAAALQGPSGKQVLDLGGGAVDAPVVELALAAAALRDRDVVLIADRRIAAGALERARRTLVGIGARPQLAVASYFGGLVDPFGPAGTPLPAGTPPVPAGANATSEPAAANEGVPDDLASVTVRVGVRGMALELARPGADPVTPELLGNVLETLNAWALRIRAAAPGVDAATVRAAVDAPWDEVVRAIDALRDSCASGAKGTPCHVRSRLFRVTVEIGGGPAPADAPVPPAAGATPTQP